MPRPDHLLLREYHAARSRQDHAEAARVWDELLLGNVDRMRNQVRLFKFKGTDRRLPEHHRDDAVNEVFIRARSMGAEFEQTVIDAFYAALHTVVRHTCHDYGRKELKHDRRAAGSLDQRYEESAEAGPYDGALADYAEELAARTQDAVEAEQSRRQAQELVMWGVERIKNDGYREVLELTHGEKLDGSQIAERLRITPANVYQRRRRGNLELERILRGL